MSPQPRRTISGELIGSAGVHHVAAELSLRGLIALPTIRNTAGVDVLVSAAGGGSFFAKLQVKTSQRKVTFWPIGKAYQRWRGEDCYYVFVRRLAAEGRFEVLLERASVVAEEVDRWEERWRQRGNAEFTPCWFLNEPRVPPDPARHDRLVRQWESFGRNVQ